VTEPGISRIEATRHALPSDLIHDLRTPLNVKTGSRLWKCCARCSRVMPGFPNRWFDWSTNSIGGDILRRGHAESPGSDGASPYQPASSCPAI
jgi:hypothetical protein